MEVDNSVDNESDDRPKGVLFEQGSGKWIELIDGGARFHSSKEFATLVDIDIYQNEIEYGLLLGKHKISKLHDTIAFQIVGPKNELGQYTPPKF